MNLKGYLSTKDVTKYKLFDFNIKSDVKLVLNKLSGSPLLFFYYCIRQYKKDKNCFFNEEKLLNKRKITN